eukprot:1032955-Amphidinium_carterae.1
MRQGNSALSKRPAAVAAPHSEVPQVVHMLYFCFSSILQVLNGLCRPLSLDSSTRLTHTKLPCSSNQLLQLRAKI